MIGYRYDMPSEKLHVEFTEEAHMALSSRDVPTITENAPIVGETSIHTLDSLKAKREQEVAFLLAKFTLDKYYQDKEGNERPWLFPQLVGIAKKWLAECVG